MPFIIGAIVIIAIIVIWAISTTNKFKRLEIKIQESLSGIEVALTKRYDLLTKLLDTAKGYMTHEKEVFTSMIKLKQGMNIDELNSAQSEMSNMSGRLLAFAEAYPELRSSDVFLELQSGIKDAEEHLQASRRLYNANVTSYNTSIVMFPASILAGGRTAKTFFESEQIKKSDVEMKF